MSFAQVSSLVAPMAPVGGKKTDTLCSPLVIFKTNQNSKTFTFHHSINIFKNRQMHLFDLIKHK